MADRVETEVLVVGGGIAGASAAYHLAALGRQVRCMGSLEVFRRLQLDLGEDIEFRQCGNLQVAQTEAEEGYAREQVAALRARGHQVELLEAREARAVEPWLGPRVRCAVLAPLSAQADPVKATRALARAAQEAGAQVRPGREVLGLAVEGDGSYVASTRAGVVRAGALVLAAGAWCAPLGRLLGLEVPVVPVRGQMWATPPLPPRVFHTISGAESALAWHLQEREGTATAPPHLTHGEGGRLTRHLYGRQRASGEVVFGGDRQAVGYNRAVEAAGVEVNRGHAAEVLPFLAAAPVQRTWAGLMPFTRDGRPLIGRVRERPNLYLVTGLASSGFGRGPMAGKLLAELVHTGQAPAVLAEADPAGRVREV